MTQLDNFQNQRKINLAASEIVLWRFGNLFMCQDSSKMDIEMQFGHKAIAHDEKNFPHT